MEQATETPLEVSRRMLPNATHSRPGPDDPIFREPITITSGRFMKPKEYQQTGTDRRQETTTTKITEVTHMDMNIIEAFKRGDRAGLPFEGCTLFPQQFNLLHQIDKSDAVSGILMEVLSDFSQEIRDKAAGKLIDRRLALALKSNHGSDESSIVDCFLKFTEGYAFTTDEQFTWDWLCYHQQHHGTGYGRTYRDHFNLVAHIIRHGDTYPDLRSKTKKLSEISAEADSFGNGCLALCYPAYCYAESIGEIPVEFVRGLTSFTHSNPDAMEAVTRLCAFIEDPTTIADFYQDSGVADDELFRERYCGDHATAFNTLVTAVKCAMKNTEMDVIREAIRIGGDVDSSLATALLLWTMKQVINE